jgi:hypothetical protein
MVNLDHHPLSAKGPLSCALTGAALLNQPFFNKGSAFTPAERRTFKLTGLLPESVQTLEQQAKRAHRQYLSRRDDLSRNTFLTSLKYQNEVLFYKVSGSIHAIDLADVGSGEWEISLRTMDVNGGDDHVLMVLLGAPNASERNVPRGLHAH